MVNVVGIALLVVGAGGLLFRSWAFVRVTIPGNYGSNPGFGVYETMALPWYAMICAGAGLLTDSWRVGLVSFAVGFFLLGFVAQLLARLARRGS